MYRFDRTVNTLHVLESYANNFKMQARQLVAISGAPVAALSYAAAMAMVIRLVKVDERVVLAQRTPLL